jgi:DNA-binding NtrC family response regulator
VIELHVPALRDRTEDILPIAEAMLPRFPGTDGIVRSLGAAAREALVDYDWPGNVRELQNRVQRASLVSQHAELTPADLGLDEVDAPRETRVRDESETPSDEAVEIEEALGRARGVISRAAAELGMSRQALYRRMARLGISVERRMTAR